jgi:hypothetical protein
MKFAVCAMEEDQMRSIMIAGIAVLGLASAGVAAAREAPDIPQRDWKNSERGWKKPADVITVAGSAQITGGLEECPPCAGDDAVNPVACFSGVLTGDLSGTFQSALFENPFWSPDAPNTAILPACSNIFLDENGSDRRLKFKTLKTEDHIVGVRNPARPPFGFDALGEFLTVDGDCQGLITLLGDALQGAPYIGRLICPGRYR